MPKIALFGYSGSGKTALFRSLTGKQEELYDPFRPNAGIGIYKDINIDKLAEIHKSRKAVYPEFEIFDFKGFPAGNGFPQHFFDAFFDMDMILCVVNNFDETSAPQKDAPSLLMELILYDAEKIQSILKKKDEGAAAISNLQADTLKKGLQILDKEHLIREMPESDKNAIYGIQLLTARSVFFYACGGRQKFAFPESVPSLIQNETDSALLYPAVMKALSLSTFYTVKGDIVQGWVVPSEYTARQAAGRIHKDIEKGFIKAAAVSVNTLVEIGSWQAAKNSGALKFLGPNSLFSDGDVVEFYFR